MYEHLVCMCVCVRHVCLGPAKDRKQHGALEAARRKRCVAAAKDLTPANASFAFLIKQNRELNEKAMLSKASETDWFVSFY